MPIIDEQRFFFDLRGWILVPGVLSEPEIESMKAEVYGGAQNAVRRGAAVTWGPPRPAPFTVHPEPDPCPSATTGQPSAYSNRRENSFTTVRQAGWKTTLRGETGRAHVVRPPQQANAMRYQVAGSQIFAGLTRVVWEPGGGEGGARRHQLSERLAQGAFRHYGSPDPLQPNAFDSPWEAQIDAAMEDYRCPPGSAIIFTESLLHAANDWTDTEKPALRGIQLLQLGVGAVAPPQSEPRDRLRHAAQAADPVPWGVGAGRQPHLLRRQPLGVRRGGN